MIEAVPESGARSEEVEIVDAVLRAREMAGRSATIVPSSAGFPRARLLRRKDAPRKRLLKDEMDGSIGVVRGGIASASEGIERVGRISGDWAP